MEASLQNIDSAEVLLNSTAARISERERLPYSFCRVGDTRCLSGSRIENDKCRSTLQFLTTFFVGRDSTSSQFRALAEQNSAKALVPESL